jgi:hypothetical protein
MAGPAASFDDFLAQNTPKPSGAPNAAPDFDTFLQQNAPKPQFGFQTDDFGRPATGPVADAYYSQGAAGHVLNAFGQGVKDNWGAGGPELAPETDKLLKSMDYDKNGDARIMKTFNEAIVRPVATAAEVSMRALSAGFSGTQAAIAEVLPRDFAALPEAEFGGRGPGHLPAPLATLKLEELARARSLGVIGEGEGAYMGTVERKPVDPELQAQAVKEQVAAAPEQGPEPAAPQVAEPAPQPDIHAVARQIAPDTFNEYDALNQRQDTFRRWIDELQVTRQNEAIANAPHADEIADLQSKMEGATQRLAKKYQARIDELQPEHDSYIEDAVSKDTPDMQRIRAELQKTDYALRDLAPQVSKAYRDARGQMPSAEAPAEAPVAAPAEAAQSVQAPEAPQAAEPAQAPQAPTAAPEPLTIGKYVDDYLAGKGRDSLEHQQFAANNADAIESEFKSRATLQPGSIASDVSKQLVKAGRPEEEANANAALVQAHYEARAARFGHYESPEEMYTRDGAAIEASDKGRKGEQGRTILKDGQATIRLMKNADASTFIHETAHHWLDEMMRDAENERAPDDLKADAKAVRDWLGVKEGEAIPTKGHEKVARGFERYIMEGRAPTQALASVFAKLKDWLTQIYQTVAKLRSPISDDIRDVFDRWLSANPERTVIAPDKEPAKAFADIHEADAEVTPPEHAAGAADNIRAEIDRIAKENVPDVHAKFPDAAATEAPGEPGENANPSGGGNAAEPVSGDNGAAQESGAVAASGNEAPSESGGLRAGTGTASRDAGGSPRTEQPTGPNERFAEPAESDLVDKAGNIRLDKLNGPEDFDVAIRDAAARNNDFLTERRNVITDGQALDLADALGKDPSFLDFKKIGSAYSTEEIIVAKRMLIQSASDVRDAMAKAATGGGDEDILALSQAISRHEMIQGKVAGATAEWGRAGRALNMVIEGSQEAKDLNQFLKENTGRTLFQLREMAQYGQKLKTPGQVSKFISDTAGGKIKQGIIYYYVNALISGPITHMRYSVGNAINALWTPIVETPIAAGYGALREAVGATPAPDRVYLGEAGAQLYGLMKGSRDGLSAAIEAFRTGTSPALRGERIPAQFSEPMAPPIPGSVGRAIGLPGKSVAAIHSFFKSLRYEQNKQALAYRQAMSEGLTGEAFNQRIAQLDATPTDQMMEAASKDALKELYMAPTDYHSAMGALNRAVNTSLPAKIIIPFMKIGSQITRNAFIERTPLGIVDKQVRANLMGENGAAAQSMQTAKIAAGTALIGSTVMMAAEGLATGDGPTDPKERAIWLLNHRPNTITIGPLSIPYQGLGSLGMLMRFSSNMYETAHAWDGEDGTKLAVAGLEGITRSVLDDNFMKGMKDALDAVYHWQEYGPAYIRNNATNWLPFSVGMGQIAREIDPYQREVHTVFEAAKARTPWVSQSLYPKRDVFGEPIPNGGPNPAYLNDPVVQAFDQLHVFPSKLEMKIRGVELTEQQYDDYARIAGRLVKMRLEPMVSQPGFSSMPLQVAHDLMAKTIEGSREAAASMVMMQNPSIVKAAMEAKVAPLRDNALKQRGAIQQSNP